MDPICELQERAAAAREERSFQAAEEYLRRALLVLERRGEANHPDAANLSCELSDLLAALRRDAEAEVLARAALRIAEAALEAACTAGLEREEILALERIGLASNSALATALRGQGRYAEAKPFAEAAAERSVQLFGEHSSEAAAKLNDLGVLCKYAGEYVEAARAYGRARDILEATPEDPYLGTVLYNLGGLAHAQGEHERAEPLLRVALERLAGTLGPLHPDVGAAYATLGAILQGQGKLDEAEQSYHRALEIVGAAYGEKHADIALVRANLSEIERARGRLERAEDFAREALRLRSEIFGPDHPQVASSLNNLAIVLAERGRRVEAARMVAEAHSVCVARCGAEHPTAKLLAQNRLELESALS